MNDKSYQNITTLLFDFDGTLLDSFSVHLDVFKLTFAHFGISLSEKEFLENYSPNWYKTYEALGLKKDLWRDADGYWLNEVEKRSAGLFTGVKELLLMLEQKFTLGLVTSGSKTRVERDIVLTGIKNHFKTIITGDDITEPKPSPEGLVIAMKNLGVNADQTIYIGDSSADFELAKAANVSFIGVRSSFDNLNYNHTEYRVYSLSELPSVIDIKVK
jgi:phosphoglycolate phosphatase/pyrophosphatase PpaX